MKQQCTTAAQVANKIPDQDVITSLFDYDKETGVLTRKISVSNRAQKGAVAGYSRKDGYKLVGINGKDYLVHRVVWKYSYGIEPFGVIDHIDGNPSNNSLINLRDVTQSINMLNVHDCQSNNHASRIRGVSYDKKYKKYFAQLQGKIIGYFDDKYDARDAYLLAKNNSCAKALKESE